jgi:hypothetical protein
MSKVSSASSYPTYTGSKLSINGFPTASTSLVNGVLNSNYNMTDAQKQVYDYAQNTLANILPQLNTFSPDVRNSMNNELNAYVQNGIKDINTIYTPMINSTENDIASRFGNLDNSIFLNNLGNIESKRSDAINSFAQDILSKQSSIENNELNKQYNYVNLLNNMQNSYYDDAMKAISSTINGSTNANNYNSNLYNTLYKQYLSNSSSGAASSLANALGLFSTLSLGDAI